MRRCHKCKRELEESSFDQQHKTCRECCERQRFYNQQKAAVDRELQGEVPRRASGIPVEKVKNWIKHGDTERLKTWMLGELVDELNREGKANMGRMKGLELMAKLVGVKAEEKPQNEKEIIRSLLQGVRSGKVSNGSVEAGDEESTREG